MRTISSAVERPLDKRKAVSSSLTWSTRQPLRSLNTKSSSYKAPLQRKQKKRKQKNRELSSVGRALLLHGRCQRFESASFHHPMRISKTNRNIFLCLGAFFMNGTPILNKAVCIMVLGQINEGLRWRPRHPETKKGADTGETLRGAGNKH